MILGLTSIILEFPVSWDGALTRSAQEAGRGNCMYQAFQDEECLGTVFLEEPDTIPQILERVGIPQRVNSTGPQEIVPCNRAIRLGSDLRVTAIEKINGTHIISAGKRIDVNLADLEDLRAVPGIGPKLAEKIIDRRDTRGMFLGIEELRQIQGIGKKKLAGWAPYIKVGPSGVVGNGLQNVQTSGSLLEPSFRIQK
jgi:competence ComEA-like helix-hairpin-helix protein